MKIRIMVMDELGDEFCEETYDANAIAAMGEHFDAFVEFRMEEIRNKYPECRGVWKEEEKTLGEQRCDRYEALYQENLEWALKHPDEIDGYDPYEWADEQTRDEFDNEWFW